MSNNFYFRLLPDLTLRNTVSFLQETGTACPSRAALQVRDFLRGIRFLNQYNWPPRYNWNIVESGIKHHKPKPIVIPCDTTVIGHFLDYM
jgi:hypothetical protein